MGPRAWLRRAGLCFREYFRRLPRHPAHAGDVPEEEEMSAMGTVSPSAHSRAPTSGIPDVGIYVRKSAKADLRWESSSTANRGVPLLVPASAGTSGIKFCARRGLP